ncbi:L-threonine 3-dehydrogenase [Elysia marginata]|uniref:L-threonine 3-dehydrogenase n=1 Tax=Elysia marginata TaxID=1093978 RepID=A0AAV4HFC6_9GAST|nr:L-threonine 3-dehydrogenase [Elysia marginata]
MGHHYDNDEEVIAGVRRWCRGQSPDIFADGVRQLVESWSLCVGREGDRVAVDPCRSCGDCLQCSRGRANICRNLHCTGVLHADGGFATYMVTPAKNCYK